MERFRTGTSSCSIIWSHELTALSNELPGGPKDFANAEDTFWRCSDLEAESAVVALPWFGALLLLLPSELCGGTKFVPIS